MSNATLGAAFQSQEPQFEYAPGVQIGGSEGLRGCLALSSSFLQIQRYGGSQVAMGRTSPLLQPEAHISLRQKHPKSAEGSQEAVTGYILLRRSCLRLRK